MKHPLEFGPSKEQFTTQEWFKRDLEKAFRPYWQLAGHIDQIPDPGSYFLFTFGADEIIVARTEDGDVSAYYNCCTHRGHKLVTERTGKLGRNIVCPYHNWAFSRDQGSCLAANRMPKSFDKSTVDLKSVWVEVFNKLVYVCLSKEAPVSVEQGTRQVMDDRGGLYGYDLKRMKLAAYNELEVRANWKIVKENDDECYHCVANHPELIEGFDPWSGPYVVENIDNPQKMWTVEEWALIELGVQQAGERICNVLSPRVDGEGSDEISDAHFFWMPSGRMILVRDYVWIWTIVPVAPDRTLTRRWWLVHEDAEEGKDYETSALMDLFEVTMTQDERLCEEVQRGVSMEGYQPGPLNPYYQEPAASYYRFYRSLMEAEVGT
ncbi:MAG: aromatic ring-hydroxylating dioxygenase subunit alpha [Roseovarius sp.]